MKRKTPSGINLGDVLPSIRVRIRIRIIILTPYQLLSLNALQLLRCASNVLFSRSSGLNACKQARNYLGLAFMVARSNGDGNKHWFLLFDLASILFEVKDH